MRVHESSNSITQIAESDDRSVKIVLAMRADFLGEFNPYPQFGKIAQQQIHLVNQMPEDELELAIKGPAAKHGVRFEPGLVKEIISDVQGQAGSLPLMQYTLDRLWEYEVNLDKLADRTLNTQNYQALGKVRGALEKHVNEIYGKLSTLGQRATKQIFLSLVKVFTKDGIDKRVSQSCSRSVLQGEALPETIDRLINENLLVSSSKNLSQAALQTQIGKTLEPEATIEIAHEILLTSWTKLQDWIQEAQATLLIKSRLVEDMGRWHEQKQANQELLKSSVLAKVLELKEKNLFESQSVALSAEEEAYIAASKTFQKRELNRTRRVAVGASIGALFMAGAAIFALYYVRQVQLQQVNLLAANAESLLLDNKPVNAIINAIAARALSQSFLVQFLYHPQFTSVESSLLDVNQVFNLEQNQLIHKKGVYFASYSPDGKHIVSGSGDGTVRIWNAETGAPIGNPLRVKGKTAEVWSVAYSPLDGKHIVSGSGDGTVRIWDAETGNLIRTLIGHKKRVNSVAYSPDGKYIVSGSKDGMVCIWDAERGNPILTLTDDHMGEVFSVAYSPLDGKHIVSGSEDGTVRIWHVEMGKQIGDPKRLKGHTAAVTSVAYSPDGTRIVSGSRDNTVRIWDAEMVKQIGNPLIGHENDVLSVAYSHDDKFIVSGSADEKVRIWNAETGAPIGNPLIGHTAEVWSVAYSPPNDKRIVSGSEDGTVRIWNAETGVPIGEPKGHAVWSVAYSPPNDKPSSSLNKRVGVWNVDTGMQGLSKMLKGSEDDVWAVLYNQDDKRSFSGSADYKVRVRDVNRNKPNFNGLRSGSVAYSPLDGKHIVTVSGDGTVRIWNAETGVPIGNPLRVKGKTAEVWSVAYSPLDGKHIVSGSGDGMVRIWDAETGNLIRTLIGHKKRVNSVAYSPDGKYIVSGSKDGMVCIWDAERGNPILTLTDDHMGEVFSVAYSPLDGKHIVSGSEDGTVRIWHVEMGKQIGDPKRLKGHTAAVTSVAYSLDGKHIVIGSEDGTVRIWDAKTGKSILTLNGHTDWVTSVAYSPPDGKRIVSGSRDNTVRIWDAEMGKQIGKPLSDSTTAVLSVSYSPDGKHIVSVDADNTVHIWDVSLESLLAIACNQLRYHPILNRPNTDVAEEAKDAKKACEHIPNWKH